METLFREILADPPTISTPSTLEAAPVAPLMMTSSLSNAEAWSASGLEQDVQKLFGMIPEMNMGLDGLGLDGNTGMDVSEWMNDLAMTFPVNAGLIGVY